MSLLDMVVVRANFLYQFVGFGVARAVTLQLEHVPSHGKDGRSHWLLLSFACCLVRHHPVG